MNKHLPTQTQYGDTNDSYSRAEAGKNPAPGLANPAFTKTTTPETQRKRAKPLLQRNKNSSLKSPQSLRYLQAGLEALRQGQTEQARRLLHASYAADPGEEGCCIALARLHGFLQEKQEEGLWLCRAVALCLKRQDPFRAENLLARLPKDKAGLEAVQNEIRLALQKEEFRVAAQFFLKVQQQGLSQPLHLMISRTCMFTDAPERNIRRILEAFEHCGHADMAEKLRPLLLQGARSRKARPLGFLEKFPLLHDILSVAAHTIKTWNKAA